MYPWMVGENHQNEFVYPSHCSTAGSNCLKWFGFFNPLTLKSKFSKCFIKACLQLGTAAKGYDVIHEYFHSLQTNN